MDLLTRLILWKYLNTISAPPCKRTSIPFITNALHALTAASSDTSPLTPSMSSQVRLGPYSGPIQGTKVDVMDHQIDIGDFYCPEMTVLDVGRLPGTLSSTNTLSHQQSPLPQLPLEDQAIGMIKHYIAFLNPFGPAIHGPTLLKLVCSKLLACGAV